MDKKMKHLFYGLIILFGIIGVSIIFAIKLTLIIVDIGWLHESSIVIFPLIATISLVTAWIICDSSVATATMDWLARRGE
jgi:NADH:ubiquinone oxidoreductase subunit 3 (subunit A)